MRYKKILSYVLILCIIFSFYCTTIYPQDTSITLENSLSADILFDKENPLLLSCPSVILMDAKTGVILYEKNSRERLYPASITKIMTALLALENIPDNDIITHSHEAVYGIGYGSSHIGMRENEEISINDALLGIMLPSANEVSVAVAEHIDETKEIFASRMTERAKELGALDTNFVNPHGFHDDNHYTTAYDMALIAKEAFKNEKFLELISTKTHTIQPTNIVSEQRIINNSNKMIQPHSEFFYPDCIGGKTGFTNEAGHTLVSYAQHGDISLIAVIMKGEAQKPYQDAKKLFDYGFGIYEFHRLFNAADYLAKINVIQLYNNDIIELGEANIIAADSFYESVPYFITDKTIEQIVTLPETIEAPVSYGTIAGKIELKYKGVLLGSINLISKDTIYDIDKKTLEYNDMMENIRNKFINILKITGVILVLALIFLIFILFRYNILQKLRLKKLYKMRNRIYPLRGKRKKRNDSESEVEELIEFLENSSENDE